MSLRKKQSEFAKALGLLILYAYQLGYEVTLEEGTATPCPNCGHYGHKDGSFHSKKLAQDVNLFKDGKYLDKTEDHEPLGLFWESLGGTWGGRFDDGNHYSWGE
ncbi:MAG: M15 family metallopeptidase domain-containing protein [Planctomycetota bacterium]|jgi:hypothetical protein